MEIQALKKKLSDLNEQIRIILSDSGYSKTADLSETEWNVQDPDECMLYYKCLGALYHLEHISQKLDVLEKPIVRKGVIRHTESGYELDGVKLEKGQCVEVLVTDEYLKTQIWKESYVEGEDCAYSLVKDGRQGRIREAR